MSKRDNQHFPKMPFQRGTDRWFDRFFDKSGTEKWVFVIGVVGFAVISVWSKYHH